MGMIKVTTSLFLEQRMDWPWPCTPPLRYCCTLHFLLKLEIEVRVKREMGSVVIPLLSSRKGEVLGMTIFVSTSPLFFLLRKNRSGHGPFPRRGGDLWP